MVSRERRSHSFHSSKTSSETRRRTCRRGNISSGNHRPEPSSHEQREPGKFHLRRQLPFLLLLSVQNPSVDENETRVLENGLRDTMARHGEEKTFVRVKLSDLSSLESIDRLTIRQLRDLLNQNFVSMKGCVERSDLIAKLQLLYRDHQRSTVMDGNIARCRHSLSFSLSHVARTQSDDNLCKICLDAPIDCVFIDCGHLCACLPCGRQLSECPLCRSYIVRLVRIFKS